MPKQHDPDLVKGIMRRGFPRPMYDMSRIYGWTWSGPKPKFLPMPYSAQTDGIAIMNEGRTSECIRDGVCSVCGELVEFENDRIPMMVKSGTLFYESGPFHHKCLVITMKMCPHIACSDEYKADMIHREAFEAWQAYFSNPGSHLPMTPDEFVEWQRNYVGYASL